MNGTKPWWQSKTLWFGALTGIAGIITAMASVGILPASAAALVSANHIDYIVTLGLWAATLTARIIAKDKLTLSDVVPPLPMPQSTTTDEGE